MKDKERLSAGEKPVTHMTTDELRDALNDIVSTRDTPWLTLVIAEAVVRALDLAVIASRKEKS